MQRRISARAIVFKNGKLLCVRLNHGRAIASNVWCIPGGGVEMGEALVPALEREMLEETGAKANVGSLLYVQQFSHKTAEYLEFFFHITNPADFESIDLAKATHAREIAEVTFIDPHSANLLPTFLTTEDIAQDIKAKSTRLFSYLT